MVALALAEPTEDKVTTLPMGIEFKTNTYSGYLSIDGSTTKQLHYVYTESQDKPAEDPLLLWFNGGPGCSSMLGFFQENGPWVVDDDNNTIYENKWSWNHRANVLYIESPAGVGFSLASTDPDKKHNDYTQSVDTFAALEAFFVKFPDLKNNELYISGESYGGIYVPYLSWQVYQANLKATVVNNDTSYEEYKLRGFMVGNGCTNWKFDAEAGWVNTLFGFDMIPKSLYDNIQNAKCDFNYSVDPSTLPAPCGTYWNETQNLTATLNPYDLYKFDLTQNGTVPGNGSESNGKNNYAQFSRRFRNKTPVLKEVSDEDPITLQKYLNM